MTFVILLSKNGIQLVQSKESVPEQVTCMKKGKLVDEAFEKVKEIWNAEPKSSQNFRCGL